MTISFVCNHHYYTLSAVSTLVRLQAAGCAAVPELKASAFGDARVHEVMDMTTGPVYTEVARQDRAMIVCSQSSR
ncbi:hypothetical protein FXB41_22970 [Bradyrhizobium canariense]|uniref:hypothetical protein n=1 Tax=Bradyrhizobium TaxID=374 RepID=UPI001CA586A4|nr:hypothetical protein [Bradyrhizobium canariense]MBW5437512.1 hypothetical protein [Bradyrhizobium canariense]